MKRLLAKTPYIFLFCYIYKFAYIFLSIFVPGISIQPIADLRTFSGVKLIVNLISFILGIIILIVYLVLEKKINSSPINEFLRILLLSVSLAVFSQTYRLYKITSYYQANKTFESWSITILCIVLSIIVLSIFFYYNEIAKRNTKEWYSVIEKLKVETKEESDFIKKEILSLKSVEAKLDSYYDIINSNSDIPGEINAYYDEIRQSYNSLMQKVP